MSYEQGNPCTCGMNAGQNKDCERCDMINEIAIAKSEIQFWIGKLKQLREDFHAELDELMQVADPNSHDTAHISDKIREIQKRYAPAKPEKE